MSEGRDHTGQAYREFTHPDGHTWREYQLDPLIARRVKELKATCSWRALAILVTGYDDQMTGSDLERLACWTLGEGCWCERCEGASDGD